MIVRRILFTAVFLILVSACVWAQTAVPYIPVPSGQQKLEALRRALLVQPSNRELLKAYYRQALYIGDGSSANEAADRLLAPDPGDAEAQLAKMAALRLLRRYEEALELSQRMLLTDGGDWRLYNNRGVLYMDLEEPLFAADALETALAMEPGNALVQSNMALLLYRSGRRDESAALYSSILRGKQAQALALNNFGAIRAREKRAAEAEDFFRASLSGSPEYRSPLFNEGALLFNRGDYGAAHEKFVFLEDEMPDNYRVKIALARTLAAMNLYASALKKFDEALALEPPGGVLSEVHMYKGLVYFYHRDYYEAGVHLREALWADPDNLEAKNNLGVCYRKMGSYSQARAILLDALEQDAVNASVCFNLASTYELAGDYGKAAEYYGRYLELIPLAADRDEVQRRIAFLKKNKKPEYGEVQPEPPPAVPSDGEEQENGEPDSPEEPPAEVRRPQHLWPRM